ncbi:MAG: hypothetical protein DRP78_03315, partial [Candidatus Omnitrophota bacterium]
SNYVLPQNFSYRNTLIKVKQAQILAGGVDSLAKLSIDLGVGYDFGNSMFGWFPGLSAEFNRTRGEKQVKKLASLSKSKVQKALVGANLKEVFIKAVILSVVNSENLAKHKENFNVLERTQLELTQAKLIILINSLLGQPLDTPLDIKISLKNLDEKIADFYGNDRALSRQQAELLMKQEQLIILQENKKILEKNGDLKFNLPAFIFLAPEPDMVVLWAGVKLVRWSSGYFNRSERISKQEQKINLENDIEKLKSTIEIDKLKLSLQKQRLRFSVSDDLLNPDSKNRITGKALQTLIQALRNGLKNGQQSEQQRHKKYVISASKIPKLAAVSDFDTIITHLNYKFARENSDLRLKWILEKPPVYSQATQWYGHSSPITTGVIELSSETNHLPYFGENERRKIEKEITKSAWLDAQQKARLKANELLIQLAWIESIVEERAQIKDKKTKQSLAMQKEALTKELKILLGISPADNLRIIKLNSFLKKQKQGADIALGDLRTSMLKNVNVLNASQIRVLSAQVEKTNIFINNLLTNDFDFKASILAGFKFSSKDNQEIKDIVAGISFKTPNVERIARRIAPYIWEKKIAENKKNSALRDLSLQLNALIIDTKGYGQKMKVSAELFLKYRQDYEAKLYRGLIQESAISQQKMIEALQIYLDDLDGFYTSFAQLKALLDSLGVDTAFLFKTQSGKAKSEQDTAPAQESNIAEELIRYSIADKQTRARLWEKAWDEIAAITPAQQRNVIRSLQAMSRQWYARYDQLAVKVVKGELTDQVLRKFVRNNLLPIYEQALKEVYNKKLPQQVRQEIAKLVGIDKLFTLRVLKTENYSQTAVVDILGDALVSDIVNNYALFLQEHNLFKNKSYYFEFMENMYSLKYRIVQGFVYQKHKIDQSEFKLQLREQLNDWLAKMRPEITDLVLPEGICLLPEESLDTSPEYFTDHQKWLLGNQEKKVIDLFAGPDASMAVVLRMTPGKEVTSLPFRSVKEFNKKYPASAQKFYDFALPGEPIDDWGRGRELSPALVRQKDKTGKRYQIWLQDGKEEYIVLFNPVLLSQKIEKKEFFRSSEQSLYRVLSSINYAAEIMVDKFGNPIGDPVGEYSAVEIVAKKDTKGKNKFPALDQKGIPLVVLRYHNQQGELIERPIGFYAKNKNGVLKKVNPGKYGYDYIITEDTFINFALKKLGISQSNYTKAREIILTNINDSSAMAEAFNLKLGAKISLKQIQAAVDPFKKGNRIMFGENSIRYDMALNLFGEMIAKGQIDKAEQSLENLRKWKAFSKMLTVVGKVSGERLASAFNLIFNAAVTLQSLQEVPTRDDVTRLFREKFFDAKSAVTALAIVQPQQAKAEKIIKENFSNLALITKKLNQLEGVQVEENQVTEALNKGAQKFLEFVRNAPIKSNSKILEDYIIENAGIKKKRYIEVMKLSLYLIDNFAGIFDVKRNKDTGLLNDWFAYFSGGEVNLMSIIGSVSGKAYLGKGDFLAQSTGRLLSGFGLTVDIFDLFSVETYDDAISPDLLRTYVLGYPYSFFKDDQAALKRFISARKTNFAIEVSPKTHMITAKYFTKSAYEKVKTKPIGDLKAEAFGLKWPVYVNELTGGIIIFGLPSYDLEFEHLKRKMRNQLNVQELKAGKENGVIESTRRESPPIVKEHLLLKEGKITLNDLVEFFVNQINPETFLNPSYFYLPGEQGLNINRNTTYLYDEALVGMFLSLLEEKELTKAKADFLMQTGGIYQYSSETKKQAGKLIGVADAIDSSSVQGKIIEDYAATGPAAYQGMFFFQAYQDTKNEKFLVLADKLAGVLSERQQKNGGLVKGVKRDVIREGDENHIRIKSGEENNGAAALFARLYSLYQQDPLKFKDFKKYRDKIKDIDNWIFSSLYDRKKGYFMRGTLDDQPDQFFATDVGVQVFMRCGPEKIDKRLGNGAAIKIWNETKKQAKVDTVVQLSDGQKIKINALYDVTNAQGHLGRATEGMLEISGQMAVGHLIMADYYLKHNQKTAAENEIAEYKQLIAQADKLQVSVMQRGTIYPQATAQQIKKFKDSINPTTDAIGASAAGAWIGFAKAGFNLLSNQYVSQSVLDLAGITLVERQPLFTAFERQKSDNLSAHLKEQTKDEKEKVLVGEQYVKIEEHRLDTLLQDKEELQKLLKKGLENLSSREQLELQRLLSQYRQYLVYFNAETSQYGYYDLASGELKKVTLNFDHKKIAADIQVLEKEKAFSAHRKELMQQGGVVTFDQHGSLIENGVHIGRNVFMRELRKILSLSPAAANEIAQRGWVYDDYDSDGNKIIKMLQHPVLENIVIPKIENSFSGELENLTFYQGSLVKKEIFDKETGKLKEIAVNQYNKYGIKTGGYLTNAITGKKIKEFVGLGYNPKTGEYTELEKDLLHHNQAVKVYYGYRLGYPNPRQIITENTITLIKMDENGREMFIRTWMNKGSLKNPKKGVEAKFCFESKRLKYDQKTHWTTKLVRDLERHKDYIDVSDNRGNLVFRFNGRLLEDGTFVKEKITIYSYKYESRFADYGISADAMNIMGMYGAAMVGETYIYDIDTQQPGKFLMHSVMQKKTNASDIADRYIDPQGNTLFQMEAPRKNLIWQQVIDKYGRTIIKYKGKKDSITGQFMRNQALYSFYNTAQIKEFCETHPDFKNELDKMHYAPEQLNYIGKMGLSMIGAAYLYDAENSDYELLVGVSILKKLENGKYLDTQGNALVQIKNVLNHLVWQQEIDNEGRLKVKYSGILNEKGEFIRQRKVEFEYEGIPGYYDIATRATAYIYAYVPKTDQYEWIQVSCSELLNKDN